MVNLDTTQIQGAIDYLATNGYHFTEFGWDPTSPVSHPIFNAYNDYNGGSTGIPQTIFFDADGNVRYAKLGGISSTATYIAMLEEWT